MNLTQIKNKKENEKDAYIMMKSLIKKPIKLKTQNFKVGNIVLYSYAAKYDKNPYDMSPLVLILGRTRKYTYGINWNWIPPALRKGLIDMVMKQNKKNIEKNKDLVIPKLLVKKIFRIGLPAFRKYLNNRISSRGVEVPYTMYEKAVNLRAENFIGISSEAAWKIAVKQLKSNKRRVRKL